MTSPPVVYAALALALISSLYWLPRRLVRKPERQDGVPTPLVVRVTAGIDVLGALVVSSVSYLSHGRLLEPGQLWRHDVWSALLIGVLAGFLLHVVGGGSPLPVASLRSSRRTTGAALPGPGFLTALLFVAGESAAVFIWFGVGLGTFIHTAPRLLSLALVALGFGFRRAACGQDHPLLGAIDGLMLALLYLATGSIVAVVVAHLAGDLLAYVSAANEEEEEDPSWESSSWEPSVSRGAPEALE
jgi:hypothetical protein